MASCFKTADIYGSAKVHKPLKNGLPPFRTILSATGTPTYKLAKFLVLVLSDITQNGFTIKDSFTFVDEILTQDSDLYMASLDVDALFTNIALDETNYKSFIPTYRKRVLLHTLLHRSFSICCDHLKTVLMKNNYPPIFIPPIFRVSNHFLINHI